MQVPKLRHERRPEVVTSQVKACALQSSGLGPLCVVTCQLPDVPPPWELERDARGLTWRQIFSVCSCLCPISGKSSTNKLLALRKLRCRCIVRIVCTCCCNTSGKSTIMTMIDDRVHVLYLSDTKSQN